MKLGVLPTITREGMIEVDRIMTQDLSIPVELMMEHAGLNLAKLACKIAKQNNLENFYIIIGSGNNGGGGLVAARRLHNWGLPVTVFMPKGKPKNQVPKNQYQRAINCGVAITYNVSASKLHSSLLIDAYIGYNFRGDLSEDAQQVIEIMKKYPLLCLDIPSGIDSTNGRNVSKLSPIATLTLAWVKSGFLHLHSNDYGSLYLTDIGVPDWVYLNSSLYDEEPPTEFQISKITHLFTKSSFIPIEINQGWFPLNK